MAKKSMIDLYDRLYSEEKPFREIWEGRIGVVYRVPKEVSFFLKYFSKEKRPSVLEVGAGDGTAYSIAEKHMTFSRYVLTEISKSAVDKLRSRGWSAEQMDSTDLKYPDDSFDIVCSYNTMHHVDDPGKMAQEMLRVARKYAFVSEANGLSIPRRLLELSERNRKANEKSYAPWKYRDFFAGADKISIHPFCFAFAFTPDCLIRASICLSEFLEKIPALRWQGSSLAILARKRGAK
ncbi:MAG: methyltransferase domain-containing protein [archaeon]